jgi:hypothetical protein
LKISEHFGGQEQDSKAELILKILEFRDEIFAKKERGKYALNGETIAIMALFGAAFGYKPCCILHFCINAYYDIKEPLSISIEDGRVLCPECVKDEVVL